MNSNPRSNGGARPRRSAAPAQALPPHSVEAEEGVLGCIFLDASATMPAVEERISGDLGVFFELRHREIFAAMSRLWAENRGIDLITVQDELRNAQRLDQVGGLDYLSALPDKAPSVANLAYYLEILWEKHLAREYLQSQAELADRVWQAGGLDERLMERARRYQEQIETKAQRGAMTPRYLKRPSDFDEEFFQHFFGGKSDAPGNELPVGFPLKIRRSECTLVSGDNGAGKSTMLSFFGLHVLEPGEALCIASLETPVPNTLWMMAAQLIGARRLPDSGEGRKRALDALAFLNKRVLVYDFQGIADWRDILDTFRYAARHHGARVFILDSIMRVGIPDDDYAQQSIAAAHFAQFAMEMKAHLFYVVHENKSTTPGKGRIRGSKDWANNANNIIRVEINSQKEEKIAEFQNTLREERAKSSEDRNEKIITDTEKKIAQWRQKWESRLLLQKQRYPGTRQNAGAYLWYDKECFQFRDRWEDQPVNWLERWKRREARRETKAEPKPEQNGAAGDTLSLEVDDDTGR